MRGGSAAHLAAGQERAVRSDPAVVAPRAVGQSAWRSAASAVLLGSAPLVALVLGVGGLVASKTSNIGPLGLVNALPLQLYAALALITVSFLGGLFFVSEVRPVLLAAHVVVFSVLLHGAATIVEPLPRFIPAWLHVGFADYIARTGRTLPELDARFSWPGFFASSAMATRDAGLPNATPLLGWTPLVVNLLYAVAVFRVARIWFSDGQAPWLAVWLFLPANWVGQDYFSPQAVNYFFFLVIIAVLVTWFRPLRLERVRRRMRRRASRDDSPPNPHRLGRRDDMPRARPTLHMFGLPRTPMLHEPEATAASPFTRTSLIVVVLLIFVASTVSHQLTPVAIVVSLMALVVVRRCSLSTLPILLLAIVFGYLSYLTVVYWSGHLHAIFGSLGHVGGTVNAGVSARVHGDPGHLLVLRVRQLLAVGIWFLAALGAYRRMRRGHGDWALFALAAAPFFLLFVQSYDGEVLLRIYTFGLPFMIVLVVALIVPVWPARYPVVAAALMCVLSLGLAGTFFIARYGNERFEEVRLGDKKAVDWVYGNATPGVTLVALTSNLPWRAENLEQFQYKSLDIILSPDDPASIESTMQTNPRGAYLILSQGQYAMGEAFYGRRRGWGEDLEHQISASSHFRLVYSQDGAKIFVLTVPKGKR
jgi:hypothetical protein